ncbi:MAG: hypothetical protein ACOYI4_08260 [Christensenellales bacterium]|jgi:hypothetical protein
MAKKIKGSRRISLTAMMMALSVLALYLAAVLPTGRVTLYVLSSLFFAPLAYEREMGLAVLGFVGASLLGLLIVPNKVQILPYVLFFGHYGLGKYLLERIRSKPLSIFLKLVYFNVCMLLIYLLAREVLFAEITLPLSPWLIVVLAQPAFILLDFAYSLALDIYFKTIHKRLIR